MADPDRTAGVAGRELGDPILHPGARHRLRRPFLLDNRSRPPPPTVGRPAGGVLLGIVIAPPAIDGLGNRPGRTARSASICSRAVRTRPASRAVAVRAGRRRPPPPARADTVPPAVRTRPALISVTGLFSNSQACMPNSSVRQPERPAGRVHRRVVGQEQPAAQLAVVAAAPRCRAGAAPDTARRSRPARPAGRPAPASSAGLAGQPGDPQRADLPNHLRAEQPGQLGDLVQGLAVELAARRPGPSRRRPGAARWPARPAGSRRCGRPRPQPPGRRPGRRPTAARRSTSPTAASPLPPSPTTQTSAR